MIVWSDKALSDLFTLSNIIEENFTNETADKVIDGLVEFVETQLINNREIGMSFEPAPHYRYLVYKGNKIFYTPYESDDVEYIIHIVARSSRFKIENLGDE
ncbi:MAG: type II toxin-antitoxin system RelE/ParE family toxin [Candidatus Paceibacterota bacterium]